MIRTLCDHCEREINLTGTGGMPTATGWTGYWILRGPFGEVAYVVPGDMTKGAYTTPPTDHHFCSMEHLLYWLNDRGRDES